MIPKYNIGDNVIINKDYPNKCILFNGNIVLIVDHYIILVSNTKTMYYDIKSNLGDDWTVTEDDISPISIELPHGKQLLLEDVLIKPKCDCGGYKVYGTFSEPAHSIWCSIFEVKS